MTDRRGSYTTSKGSRQRVTHSHPRAQFGATARCSTASIAGSYAASIKPQTVAQSGLKSITDDDPKWTALGRVLENPYWSRVWIVQEIVVSREVDVLYGGRWFDWALFSSHRCSQD